MAAKYKVGLTVKVKHPTCGTWEGEIISSNFVDEEDGKEIWEYEVSNAPAGNKDYLGWLPLAWEDEIDMGVHK